MKQLLTRIALAGLLLGGGSVTAPPASAADESPDADHLIAEMKAATEPKRPSVRLMTLSWSSAEKASTIELVQARKIFPDGARSLTFVTQPPEVRGMAYLVEEQPGRLDNHEHRYIPVVRRVRELVPAENYETFLGTDFTYGDLGFLPLDSTNVLLGEETIDGRIAYKVESTPSATAKQWYYARYVTWVDARTKLPIKREFHSPAGRVFKVETFDDVTVIDGVPTPTRITMTNLPAKSTSRLDVVSVSYERTIPDEFFTPEKLRELSEAGNAAERAAESAKP